MCGANVITPVIIAAALPLSLSTPQLSLCLSRSVIKLTAD